MRRQGLRRGEIRVRMRGDGRADTVMLRRVRHLHLHLRILLPLKRLELVVGDVHVRGARTGAQGVRIVHLNLTRVRVDVMGIGVTLSARRGGMRLMVAIAVAVVGRVRIIHVAPASCAVHALRQGWRDDRYGHGQRWLLLQVVIGDMESSRSVSIVSRGARRFRRGCAEPHAHATVSILVRKVLCPLSRTQMWS